MCGCFYIMNVRNSFAATAKFFFSGSALIHFSIQTMYKVESSKK